MPLDPFRANPAQRRSDVRFTSVFAAVALDLQRRMVDMEAALEARSERVQQCVFLAAIRHHQMRRQGDVGGAEGPYVQVMNICHSALIGEERHHRRGIDARGDAIERQVQ